MFGHQATSTEPRVVIVEASGRWTGAAGYQRWLDLNGIDRSDPRLAALEIRLRSSKLGVAPASQVYILPKSVYRDLVGDLDFALEYPEMI